MEQMTLADMPRRLFSCTPSRLSAFEDCPRRYRMVYLDRPSPARGPAWAHTSLGVSVHNALHRWWDAPLARRTPEWAGSLLRSGWVDEGFRDSEQSAAWRDRAAEMVERYTAGLDPVDEPRATERQVATRTDRLALHGRIDRLDERGGELVVVDYKTGRRPPDEADARSSSALALYALAAERTLRTRCRRVELHHLPTGTAAVAEHTEDTLARHLRRAESVAADAVDATERRNAGDDQAFPARPGPLCSWCDFRRHCPEGRSVSPERQPWAGLGDADGRAVAATPGGA